jgi:hypothetical protein
MSEAEGIENGNGAQPDGNAVLANLPRSRPQRSSARRVAARETASAGNGTSATAAGTVQRKRRPADGARAASANGAGKQRAPRAGKGAKQATSAARSTRKRPRAVPIEQPAPRQGFESESDTPAGSIQPPGGIELLASAAELVGELAKSGLSRSERLLKDVVSRMPLP